MQKPRLSLLARWKRSFVFSFSKIYFALLLLPETFRKRAFHAHVPCLMRVCSLRQKIFAKLWGALVRGNYETFEKCHTVQDTEEN